MALKSDEKGAELPIEGVTDLERVATRPQTAAGDEKEGELLAVTTTASERLPFSKARCVALVTTIAAAPFLSVSKITPIKRDLAN